MTDIQLNYHLDPGFQQLGIHTIIAAEIRGIDNTQPLSAAQKTHLQTIAQQVINTDADALAEATISRGYRECITQIGRSAKKFPPSALALSGIVQRAGRLPSINPLVDLYNGVALQSLLSLGVHDMDKLHGTVSFRFCTEPERFVQIGGGEKQTQPGDYVYADEQTVLAWLDARDSELVKVTENTRNVLIIAQGNAATSNEMRIEVLHDLCTQITEHCGGQFQLLSIEAQRHVIQ